MFSLLGNKMEKTWQISDVQIFLQTHAAATAYSVTKAAAL
jgi:hypothetical protein